MAITLQTEIDMANLALDRLAAKNITLAGYASEHIGQVINRHFFQTRNALFRSYVWPFAKTRTELVQIETLTLDDTPAPAAFAVGATLTGATSGTTATVIEVTSDTVYVVAYTSGDWTDGEIISDGTNSRDCAAGYPITAVTEPNHQYSYQYELPTDFARLVGFYEFDVSDYEDDRFTIEGNRILTNYTTMNIEYIKTITDPDDWDSLFKDYFILMLALKIQPAIAGNMSASAREDLKRDVTNARSQARVTCSQENEVSGRDDFNWARY